jgi:hypothetical protein
MCVRLVVDPMRTFRQIALVALLLSFVPNIAAGFLMRPAVDWPSMLALMSMHVVAWAAIVGMLSCLAVPDPDPGDETSS